MAWIPLAVAGVEFLTQATKPPSGAQGTQSGGGGGGGHAVIPQPGIDPNLSSPYIQQPMQWPQPPAQQNINLPRLGSYQGGGIIPNLTGALGSPMGDPTQNSILSLLSQIGLGRQNAPGSQGQPPAGQSGASGSPMSIMNMLPPQLQGLNKPGGFLNMLPQQLQGLNKPGGFLNMLPNMGGFAEGGIVPETGNYPVKGGEEVVPRHKVSKHSKKKKPTYTGSKSPSGTATLHAGEEVVPPYGLPHHFGSYQAGGPIIYDPGMSTPDVQKQPGAVNQNTLGDPRMQQLIQAMANAAKQRESQQQGQRQAAGIAFPGRVGTTPPIGGGTAGMIPNLMSAYDMQAMGGGYTAPPSQVQGISAGGPPIQPGGAGGPWTSYIPQQLAQGPPYQSEFYGKGEKSQYQAARLRSDLMQGLMAYKQHQYDKTVEESRSAGRDATYAEMARQAAAAGTQTNIGAGAGPSVSGGGIGAGAMPPPQGQPQGPAAGGQIPGQAPGSQQGYPGAMQAGGGAFGQQLGQPGQLTPDQQNILRELQKTDPKMAQQYQKKMEQQTAKRAKMLAKIQEDPFGPEARGWNMGIQDVIQQQTAQAEMAVKVEQARAAAMKAQVGAMMPEIILRRQQGINETNLRRSAMQAGSARERTNAYIEAQQAALDFKTTNATMQGLKTEFTTTSTNLRNADVEQERTLDEYRRAVADYNKLSWYNSLPGTRSQSQTVLEQARIAHDQAVQRYNEAKAAWDDVQKRWNNAAILTQGPQIQPPPPPEQTGTSDIDNTGYDPDMEMIRQYTQSPD